VEAQIIKGDISSAVLHSQYRQLQVIKSPMINSVASTVSSSSSSSSSGSSRQQQQQQQQSGDIGENDQRPCCVDAAD